MSLKAFARLSVDRLDDRTLPSASILNLTAPGAEVAANGFIARQIDASPAADFTKFVRLDGCWTEQGYNTTAPRQQFDEVPGGNFSRELRLSQVPVVIVDGVAYREFILNANQRRWSPLLSLDKVQVFLGETSDLTGYRARAGTLGGQAPVFDLDAGGNVSLLMNANLNRGTGFGDMALLIPDAAFAGASPDSFVYLYSKFGGQFGAWANGGAEAWSVRNQVAPPPGGASLSGMVYVDANGNGVKDTLEPALPGVTIRLQMQDDNGNITDVGQTATDENGFYEFTGLAPGTYIILETQPIDLNTQPIIDSMDYVGSLGGDGSINDQFSGIVVGENQHGVGYNFTELLFG